LVAADIDVPPARPYNGPVPMTHLIQLSWRKPTTAPVAVSSMDRVSARFSKPAGGTPSS